MSDLLMVCTHSLNPCWSSFLLCRIQITHYIYWLALTSTFYFPHCGVYMFTMFSFKCLQASKECTDLIQRHLELKNILLRDKLTVLMNFAPKSQQRHLVILEKSPGTWLTLYRSFYDWCLVWVLRFNLCRSSVNQGLLWYVIHAGCMLKLYFIF